MSKALELMHERQAALTMARAMVNDAETANRGFTADEETRYQDLIGKADSLLGRIDRQKDLDTREAAQGESARGAMKPGGSGDAFIGMDTKEIRRYSLTRAMHAMASGNWRDAQLERECSDAVARQLGFDPQGIFVPYDWQIGSAELRDLSKGTAGAGGYLVGTDLKAGDFITLLRNQAMVMQAGATMLDGLVGDIAIPRLTGGGTAYWVAEAGAPTESQQTVDQVAMSPKTLGAYTDYSRKLVKQASLSVENFVKADLSTIVALEIDRGSLHGTGSSNQPTGIAATAGIGSVAGGTNGLAPAWSHIVSLETEVAVDNAAVGKLAYMTNPKVRGKMKQTSKVASTDSIMLWSENDSPVNGYKAHVTSQVSSALTKGSSSGVCSAIFFGNWADLIVGLWGGLDLLVDPYTASTSGTTRIVALQDVDVAVRHPESFAAMLDALTT